MSFPVRGASRPLSVLAAALIVCGSRAALAKSLDAGTAASGLQEALSVGTGKAVDVLGVKDGFLGNKDVRIRMPSGLSSIASVMKALGQGEKVDEFEVSMNRAAESAVPVARKVFLDSIKEMSFDDAIKVLGGGNHSATDYLKEHAGPKLAELFRPTVKTQLDSVGATRSFEGLMSQASALPLGGGGQAFELDKYVTGKALDGLFLMVGREEENIRKNPLGRSSSLLRQVFGSREAHAHRTPQQAKPAPATDPLKSIQDALQHP